MQDVCSGVSSDVDNSDTIYTQQQITAMVSDADCMYNRRQLATTEQPNAMNSYHQDLTTELIPATSIVSNDRSDERHYYTATTGSRPQQHFIHNNYTPSGLCKF
uniref:Bm11207 n=1 Tax=Brugia malayi TaxID=6279 RepID=A0A1I9G938_BRUMA|nr:Bm11207 [Brugia malayi]